MTLRIISQAEYTRLIFRDRLLAALEAGGVDNWEWYSDSINEHDPAYWDDLYSTGSSKILRPD